MSGAEASSSIASSPASFGWAIPGSGGRFTMTHGGSYRGHPAATTPSPRSLRDFTGAPVLVIRNSTPLRSSAVSNGSPPGIARVAQCTRST